MNRKPLFTAITLAIPVLFFVLLELSLRLVGYGETVSLFVENPQSPDYLTPRPDVIKRYFRGNSTAPSVTIETNFFRKHKPENGLRIFVQGGSTAAGFPYGFGASIAGQLDYRLKQSFPDRPVEVINTALAAVNSYTVLDFADEIIAQAPDAVLIYAGHNEYLGILGVGSTYSLTRSQSLTRAYLLLKESRIFQLVTGIYVLFASPPDIDNESSRTFMAKVARDRSIPFGSDLYEAGLEQFRGNMARTIARYESAGIPVFIATIASNLSGQKPFQSAPTETADPLVQALFQNSSADDQATLDIDTLARISRLATSKPSADLHFALASAYENTGNLDLAEQHYRLAKDYDLLRFRAPSAMNGVIRDLARESDAHLVDAHAQLVKRSGNGIIGNDLMLEHLHPNLEGYFAIADSFYNALRSSGVLGQFPQPVSAQRARRELPVLSAEEFYGRLKIAVLMSDYPFTLDGTEVPMPTPSNRSERIGQSYYDKKLSWIEMASQSFEHARSQPLLRQKIAKLMADALPHKAELSYQAGVILIESKRPQEATRYLKHAVRLDPQSVNHQLALAHAYIEQKRYTEAIPWIESVLKLDPDNPTALAIQRNYRR
jgi:tetratricopeptide (TPR) repeat protein